MSVFGSDEIRRQVSSPKDSPDRPSRAVPMVTTKSDPKTSSQVSKDPAKPMRLEDQILNAFIIVLFGIEVVAFMAYAACSAAFSFMGGIGIPFLLGALVPYFYLRFLYSLWNGAKKEGTSLVAPLLLAAIPVVIFLPMILKMYFRGGF